jgi:hypothetical protein
MSGVVAFAGSCSVVSPLVQPAVRAVLASGRSVVVGDAAGVDAAGSAARVVSRGGGGRWAPAVRTRAVVAAALAGGPGSGLVAFPSGPCPAVCRPVPGPLSSGRVSGGGSGSWLAVALAVGLGLPSWSSCRRGAAAGLGRRVVGARGRVRVVGGGAALVAVAPLPAPPRAPLHWRGESPMWVRPLSSGPRVTLVTHLPATTR